MMAALRRPTAVLLCLAVSLSVARAGVLPDANGDLTFVMNAHNKHRGVAGVEKLQWSPSLERAAAAHAVLCKAERLESSADGQNVASRHDGLSSGEADYDAAVAEWASAPDASAQMLTADATHFGCARAACSDATSGSPWTVIVCHYGRDAPHSLVGRSVSQTVGEGELSIAMVEDEGDFIDGFFDDGEVVGGKNGPAEDVDLTIEEEQETTDTSFADGIFTGPPVELETEAPTPKPTPAPVKCTKSKGTKVTMVVKSPKGCSAKLKTEATKVLTAGFRNGYVRVGCGVETKLACKLLPKMKGHVQLTGRVVIDDNILPTSGNKSLAAAIKGKKIIPAINAKLPKKERITFKSQVFCVLGSKQADGKTCA